MSNLLRTNKCSYLKLLSTALSSLVPCIYPLKPESTLNLLWKETATWTRLLIFSNFESLKLNLDKVIYKFNDKELRSQTLFWFKPSQLKLRVFLTGYAIAMVTWKAKKITLTWYNKKSFFFQFFF